MIVERMTVLQYDVADGHVRSPGGVARPVVASELATRVHVMAWGAPVMDLFMPPRLPIAELECRVRAAIPASAMGSAPPAAKTDVTVVIPTCFAGPALQRCLESVAAQKYLPERVVIVDNRPARTGEVSPGVAEVAAKFADELDIVTLAEPRKSLSLARNAGAAVATTALVAFCDDDVLCDPHWLQRSAARFEADSDTALLMGQILPVALDRASEVLVERYGGFSKGYELRYWQPDTMSPPYPWIPGLFGSGANIVVRREAFDSLRGFSPWLGAGTPSCGGEDITFAAVAVAKGYGVVYDPSAVVWHHHETDPSRLLKRMLRYGIGLGAALTAWVVQYPEARSALLANPRASVSTTRDRWTRHSTKGRYPKELKAAEAVGVMLGPFAYTFTRCTR